jgi:site-specific recombinase XerD
MRQESLVQPDNITAGCPGKPKSLIALELEDFIFCREGTSYTADHIRERVIRPAMMAAGIEIVKHESGIHVLRHSAGTILYEMTRDIELVKRFLRQSRISTTSDIYVHADSSIAAEAIDAMAQVYFGVKEVEGVQ